MAIDDRRGIGVPRVLEFFAGIGLARLGLEQAGAEVVWANDYDADKIAMYRNHFGLAQADSHLLHCDVAMIKGDSLPDADIAWSSFPCTDLSLAGNRRGLAGSGSGTFWHFVRILEEMGDRRPTVVGVENVVGFATSHAGEDLAAALRALNDLGYSTDVLTLDARRFVPQSRPRLFVVGTASPQAMQPAATSDGDLRPDWLLAPYGDPTLSMHQAQLPSPPAPLTAGLGNLVERTAVWWDQDRTQAFMSSLSSIQSERLAELRRGREVAYRTAYRRTRQGVARWEIRPDDIAGCLRTARGGSSKQAVVRAGRGSVRVRWMTPTEYARLMGADDYTLQGARLNQLLFGFGDAVCVPAVEWLAEHYLVPAANGLKQVQSQRGA